MDTAKKAAGLHEENLRPECLLFCFAQTRELPDSVITEPVS